jgi:hypothetical protein
MSPDITTRFTLLYRLFVLFNAGPIRENLGSGKPAALTSLIGPAVEAGFTASAIHDSHFVTAVHPTPLAES